MIRQFRVATTVHMGDGASAGLLAAIQQIGATRITVVTDPGVASTGMVERILAPVRAAGLALDIDTTTKPNPRDTDCNTGTERAKAFGTELLVAVGGGSPIDQAKAIACLITNGGKATDWAAHRPFAVDPLPLIAIPTTAGTGSEVTSVSVVTDTARMFKMTMGDPRMAPTIALVDPELTWSVPKGTTAATGMDALTHAIEAYTCIVHNPVSDGLALRAMRMIANSLVPVVDDGSNRAARAEMMYASTIAGMAFGNADVAAVHCISEAIGGLYDTPHGIANSVFLPWVFEFNRTADPARHADVAECLGVTRIGRSDDDVAAEGAQRLTDLGERIGIPRFRDLPGVDPADFERLAAASEENGSTPDNARPITKADYLQILHNAYTG
ncbi:MAG TPA: iron-containing alcohol dehydrogenase [Thermomicrobiales bacterium]|nr:iron-containing alcohol dehydrogenase [Thermomicrobiales bacterium]